MNTKVTRNLQIGFGLSLSLLIASSVLSWFCIRNLLKSSELVDHSNLVATKLENVISSLKDAETGQRGYLLTGTSEYLQPYNGAQKNALDNLEEVLTLTTDNMRQQQYGDQLKNILTRRLTQLKDLIDKKNAGKEITTADLKVGKEYMDEARDIVNSMRREENRILSAHQLNQKRFTTYTPIVIVLAALLAIIISIVFYLRVLRDLAERLKLQLALQQKDKEITDRLNVIQDIAEKVSNGDYEVRVNDEQKDTLGSLSGSLNKMAASLSTAFNEITRNEWLQTGMAQLNDKMVGEKDVNTLSGHILNFLAEYSNSHTGALYLSDAKILKLESTFATSEQVKKEIAPGEGIAGQAIANNRQVLITDISADDVSITHATGNIKPKNIIALPFSNEGQIKGVIELASIHSYDASIIGFLHTATHSIGIAIQSAQNRKKLQELLEETQAQSEELQAQHNELENLNAELEAHAQKLQTSEEELRVQQEELQQNNQELEERNRIIIERNLEIQKKAKELEQSTKYKSEFMANMSHELRTPLNSILLLSRFLAENNEANLTEDQIESARVILSSGSGLLDLIDELLDLSKIEAGKMELDYTMVQLSEIMTDIGALFAPVAKEKKLDLFIESKLSKDITFQTDKMKLEQVLKNLVSNALKFTSEGFVRLDISEAPDNSFIEFSVTDTGVGIAQDKQHLVFEAFKQEDGSTKRKYGGTGLGLSISRELARLLGGEINICSEQGKGSKFTVLIPKTKPQIIHLVQQQTQQVETKALAEPVETKSKYLAAHIPQNINDDRTAITHDDKVILIIEDDTIFAKALLEFTRKQGYKGIVAVRGDEGVDLAMHYKPLAILLDIQLPVKDGWEVMEELKSQPGTRHIPVHIMSSLEVKRESRLKGAVDFISKPIAVEQMQQIFSKLEDALTRSPKKVLIVEENPKHARALAYFLETFNVSSAVSGSVKDGVDTLKNKEVDCVILDMGIPDRNAYETLETIKQNPGLEDLPIIIFTGKNLSSAEESRIKQYADSIVVKTAHSYQRILDEVALFLHLIEEQKKPKALEPKAKDISSLNDILNGKTVLVADDDVRNIFSLTKSLEKHKMNVISAIDGREALTQLEQYPETAIVLMDMMMPEMDGYETTTKIRQHPRFKNIPVIAVTAKAMLGDREKCITAGASDYISKPVDIDQLISLLRVWLYDKTI